jgi:hypothetical protein
MNPALKALVAAAVGGAVPAALSSMQNCGSDMKTLAVQALAGAIVAVAYLFADKPKQEPTTKSDDPPPTAGGGN